MEKYTNMVSWNKKINEEKVANAIQVIREMESAGEKVQICELTKQTGLSRGFFYKNQTVRRELERVIETQKGCTFEDPRRKALNKALEWQLEKVKQELEKKEEEIIQLKAENEKLKTALERKELEFISNL